MSGFQFPPPPPPPPRRNDPGYQSNRGDAPRGRGRGRAVGRGGSHQERPSAAHSNTNSDNRAYQSQQPPAAFPAASVSHSSAATGANAWNPSGHHAPSVSGDRWQDRSGTGCAPHAQWHRGDQAQSSRDFPSNSGNWAERRQGLPSQGLPSRPERQPPHVLAGQKRKAETLDPAKPAAAASSAPSVPGFGAPIVPSPATVFKQQQLPGPSSKTGQRTSNALGLLPTNDDGAHVSSEDEEDVDDKDDEVDEEAMFAELGAKLTFEHNGSVMSLTSQADLARWKEERIRNFPTRSRMVAKLDEKRQLGEVRQSLLLRASLALRRNDARALDPRHDGAALDTPNSVQGHTPDDDTAQTAIMPSVVAPDAETHDASDPGAEPVTDQAAASVIVTELSDPVGVQRPESSDINPGHSEEITLEADEPTDGPEVIRAKAESDDEPPETVTTKAPLPEPSAQAPVCKYFATRGQCRNGDNCRYKHERLPETERPTQAANKSQRDALPPRPVRTVASSGRKGVHQALLDQEEDTYNQKALQVIKYLGKAGFFAQAA